MDAMVDAYMQWTLDAADQGLGTIYVQPEDTVVENTHQTYIVDLFSASFQQVPIIRGDRNIASVYIHQGLLPTAPHLPSVAITMRMVEIFHATQLHCPRLGLQLFICALCDIHGLPPRAHLTAQFSVTFDLYLAICAEADWWVQAALGRDSPNWRLKNACPACLYKLESEKVIPLPFLVTMDSNNSLKRFWWHEREVVDASGRATPGMSKEQLDNCVAPGDYYIPCTEVDKWLKEGMEELVKDFVPGSGDEDAPVVLQLEDEGGRCEERWQNMKEDITARAYGMYDETGFFPYFCRHLFVLVVIDIVKSGELAKYGFAITAHLLQVIGEVVEGYNIGCKFGKMVQMHPALSALAMDNNFKALVGAFHSHAHNWCCQLKNLSIYVKGMGLEDLEECESFFSKSNALAATTQYATAFHRQQAISTYLKHVDTADAYQGLYQGHMPMLQEAMSNLGVESCSVFEEWLEKEKCYLESLTKEPEHEMLEMEYYQKLVNLANHKKRLNEQWGMNLPFISNGVSSYEKEAAETQRLEMQRHHALERWEPEDAEWVAATIMVVNWRYQRALDELEGLVVARMFELSKAHMSDTGYKLRKHIAKALQAWTRGLRSALDKYNAATTALSPPRTQLTWEQIMKYAFLADFNLLHEGQQDIRSEPWVQPAGCLVMDQYFKLLRTDKEIAWLNLEIRRFVTHMVDEERFLVYHEGQLHVEGKLGLGYQVRAHRMECACFNASHMEHLVKLSKEDGFTGSIAPGASISKECQVPEA
ncbi:hypothetical protein MSAN_00764300 [Mycena sanguinolenta]|uniref:Uncharacterized protein n=1 Tax=Mycena sanguinolenta TaxID=230812 RepID=A0A8H6Z654_9AGAR|nr:hypothetical protein MSAN_00764300 [Mycena sanguinolenta]